MQKIYLIVQFNSKLLPYFQSTQPAPDYFDRLIRLVFIAVFGFTFFT